MGRACPPLVVLAGLTTGSLFIKNTTTISANTIAPDTAATSAITTTTTTHHPENINRYDDEDDAVVSLVK